MDRWRQACELFTNVPEISVRNITNMVMVMFDNLNVSIMPTCLTSSVKKENNNINTTTITVKPTTTLITIITLLIMLNIITVASSKSYVQEKRSTL
jgi:hypothetical protein